MNDLPPVPSISVVSPVYGCSQCLESLVERIDIALFGLVDSHEVIFVDDASPDDAWTRIVELAGANPKVRGLRLSRNFGQHPAIFAGIDSARGRYVVVMDCDLQDMPEQIPLLYQALVNEGHEAVFARRTVRHDGPFKRLGSFLFYRFLASLTNVPQDHRTANFGIYTRKVIDIVRSMPEAERFFPLMVKWAGFQTGYVDVSHGEREQGRSSYSFRKLLRLALSVVLSYSDQPLRMVVKAGLSFALLAFIFVVFSIWRWFAGDIAVAGFTSIIASIWLLGGAMVFSIGVVGLYVGRTFNDAKRRPQYIIDRTTDGKSADTDVQDD